MTARGRGARHRSAVPPGERVPPERALPPSPEKRLWFGILAAPAAWSVHEIAGYAIAGQGCMVGEGRLPGWAWAGLIGVSVLCVAVAAAGALVSLMLHRRLSRPGPVWRTEGWGRREFMAAAGFFLSAILLLNLVMFSVMPIFVDPCVVTT